MTTTLCVLAAIALFTVTVLASREMIGKSPLRISWALHALAVLLILVALNTSGIWYFADLYLGDIWTAHDALHKTAQGSRSSLDYFNPIGPVLEWLLALTLLIQAPSSYSLVLANVVVASLSLALTLVLLQHRASAITVAIVGLIAVTTALSPRDIDTLITMPQSSMLAPYNRWGWALLAPIAMRAALPGSNSDVVGSVLAGVAITLLLLLKVTYGLAAIGIFVVVVILYPARWRELCVVAVSILFSIPLLDWFTGGQIGAYFRDLASLAQIPANGIRLPKFLAQLPALIAFAAGCLLLISVSTRHANSKSGRLWWANWRVYIITLAVGGSGLVVLMQNHYTTEAVTLLLMPLIVAERKGMLAGVGGQPFGIWKRDPEWIGAILLVTLALPAIDAGYILAQKVQTHRKMYLAAPFRGSEFSKLVIDEAYKAESRDQCSSRTCNDVQRMLSGRELIQRSCPVYRTAAILAFNFSNPFPALLGSPSPRFAPIWLDVDRSFSREVNVPARMLFSDVGCVIIAKNDRVATAMGEIYGNDLRRSFRPMAENSDWYLWVRGAETKGGVE